MSKMLELVSSLVKNFPEDLSDEMMDFWNEKPREVQRFLEGLRRKPSSELLRRVGAIQINGVQKFIVDDTVLEECNVGWTNDNFNRLFRGKVEENIPEAKLAVSQLGRDSLDAPILTELSDKAETLLVHMFALLKKQSRGETGTLLVSGYANIFYIREIDNNLWAVYAGWYSSYGYWDVGACSVVHPDRWHAGSQILSRDS